MEAITVVMTTNLIPSHPATTVIDETITSLKRHLPGVEPLIWVLADGLKKDQLGQAEDYARYKKKLRERWTAVKIIEFLGHTHQTEMLREVLPQVKTPLILWVEHDWPLLAGEKIEWEKLAEVLLLGEVTDVTFTGGVDQGFLREPWVTSNGLAVTKYLTFSGTPNLGRSDFFAKLLENQRGCFHLEHTATRLFCERDNWTECRIVAYPRDRAVTYSPNGRAFGFKFENIKGLSFSYSAGLSVFMSAGEVNGRYLPQRKMAFPPSSTSFVMLSYVYEFCVSQGGFWKVPGYLPLAEVKTDAEKVTSIIIPTFGSHLGDQAC
jgi:hypothetical protein